MTEPHRIGPTLAERRFEEGKVDLAILSPIRSIGIGYKACEHSAPIGFNKDLRGLLLTDPIAVPEWKGRTHEVFYYLALVKETEGRILGSQTVGSTEPDIRLDVSEERLLIARANLQEAGVDLSRPIVAIGPGSTNSRAKRWPAERFATLADLLSSHANVVIVGALDEQPVAEEVLRRSDTVPIDLTGKTDLAEVTSILALVDVFVSNDMGLAHVAAAVGTETIVIFGPTNEITTRPYGANSTVIRHQVECSPCMLRDCPIDHRCMTGVSVDKVFQAATLRLQPASPIIG